MTSEIVIINKFGLALAADSAITVEQFHEKEILTKTYNSANKLFSLSKHAPVAAMFYNAVNLGGVPWETVIKSYRKHLGRRTFPTLEEYSEDFFSYLEGNTKLFPRQRIENIVGINVYRELTAIREKTKNKKEFSAALAVELTNIQKKGRIRTIDENFEKTLLDEYQNALNFWINTALPKSYITGNIRKINKYISELFCRERLLKGYSGLVIAGFGEDDYLPKLQHFACDCVVNKSVRRWLLEIVEISESNPGKVVPLADSDVTKTIISGVNPRFQNKSYIEAFKIIAGLPDVFISSLPGLSDVSKKFIREETKKTMAESIKEFYNVIEKMRKDEYENPINRTISSLPIAELGSVAETFINASQIHKRVNPGFETIGGPVDVAIISKGDGFVWAKRKHYFDSAQNPTFALNYLDD